MKILLAPMEGVVNHTMRDLLTRIGGYHLCVTEFVRVTDQQLPNRVFRRLCPELNNDGCTSVGTPVVVQLLGGNPESMANNAARVAALGARGIDINFGCPSKIVNRRAGGAVLLKEPERVNAIVAAVRKAVPAEIPVTGKIRLGYEDTNLALENAHAVEDGGAAYITVHARTKLDGYRPPARWEWLATINDTLSIPVIANGDINSVEDYIRCREISGCEDVMIGRGAISRPDLARQIQNYQQDKAIEPIGWSEVHGLLLETLQQALAEEVQGRHAVARIKQWLAFLKREYSEAQGCFEQIRRTTCHEELIRQLNNELAPIR